VPVLTGGKGRGGNGGRGWEGERKGEGYIAGATNPIFARREEWWDLLCDLDQGHCYLPGEKRGGGGTAAAAAAAEDRVGKDGGREGGRGPAPEWLEGEALSSEMDAIFMTRVQATVAAAEAAAPAPAAGLEAEWEGRVRVEEYLRGIFQAHTQSLLDLASGGAQMENSRAREGARKLALANSYRIQALRQRAGVQVRKSGRGGGWQGGVVGRES